MPTPAPIVEIYYDKIFFGDDEHLKERRNGYRARRGHFFHIIAVRIAVPTVSATVNAPRHFFICPLSSSLLLSRKHFTKNLKTSDCTNTETKLHPNAIAARRTIQGINSQTERVFSK